MARDDRIGAHVVVGGFPPGSAAAHDIDYARRRLLDIMAGEPRWRCTVANDFADLERWLPTCRFLVSYVAGPYPDGDQHEALVRWLEEGGRWLALHGTSGGRAAPVDGNRRVRRMVKLPHHQTLGAFFLNHPPICRFSVTVTPDHPLTAGLPDAFEAVDELYLLELTDPGSTTVLLTTELERDPSPPGFGFTYDRDTSVGPDGRTRVLGFVRQHGAGAVAYVALGHCHSPVTNSQPFVDTSVDAEGRTPLTFRGMWENESFLRLLTNGMTWALAGALAPSA